VLKRRRICAPSANGGQPWNILPDSTVAMEESSICVIDREGQVALETRVTIDPDAIFRVLKPYVSKLRRLGHVTGRQHPLPADTEQLTLPVYCTPKAPKAITTSKQWQPSRSATMAASP